MRYWDMVELYFQIEDLKFLSDSQYNSLFISFGSVLCIVALATLTLEFNAMRKHLFPSSPNWEVGVN